MLRCTRLTNGFSKKPVVRSSAPVAQSRTIQPDQLARRLGAGDHGESTGQRSEHKGRDYHSIWGRRSSRCWRSPPAFEAVDYPSRLCRCSSVQAWSQRAPHLSEEEQNRDKYMKDHSSLPPEHLVGDSWVAYILRMSAGRSFSWFLSARATCTRIGHCTK